jgi:hypothetical protein
MFSQDLGLSLLDIKARLKDAGKLCEVGIE